MKCTGVLLLALCLTTLAYAAIAGSSQEINGSDQVLENPGKAGGRSGGDTIAEPNFIPAIPYVDTGNTCDYDDDYDEVCSYEGATSPDVVYAYSPPSTEVVDIDLCGSSYDTKVFVYENEWTPGNPYACNDDYYFNDPCGVWVSKIEQLTLFAGNTYYIVIDGYNGDCGDYVLEVSSASQPPLLTVEVTFSPNDVIVSTITGEDDETYTVLKLPDSSVLAEFDSTSMLGEPMLPMATVYVAMPPGVGADEVAVSTFTKESIPTDYPIWPAQPPRTLCGEVPDDDWCSPDPAVYEVDATYPGQIVQFVGMTDIAGQGLAILHVYPIEYNPVQQECSLFTSILLEIPEGEPYIPEDYLPAGTSLLGRTEYEEMIAGLVINPDGVQCIEDPLPAEPFLPDFGEIDHAIIAPATLAHKWSRLAMHRTKLGRKSRIFSVGSIYNYYPGLEDVERIRSFIRDAHNECGIRYFLLAGTLGDIPIKIGGVYGCSGIPSDRYYADYDQDWQDEVYVGRVTANNPAQVEDFVNKLIRYETGYSATKDALLIGMDLDGWTKTQEVMEVIDSETLQPRSWSVEKVYDDDDSNHEEAIIAAINSGTHLVIHDDHSNDDALGTGWFRHESLLEFTELVELYPPEGRYMVFASGGCLANEMFGSSIARDLVVHSGDNLAVAFAGNTNEVSYMPGEPFSFSGGILKRFTAKVVQRRTIGSALSNAKCMTWLDREGPGEWAFNLLGDPAMPVVRSSGHPPLGVEYPDWEAPWAEGPFPMHVENESGDPIEGAYVCLWEPVPGDSCNIYLTGFTDAAGDISFTVPASDAGMYVTVSHADYPPYMGEVGAPATDVDSESPSDGLLHPVRLELHPAAPSPFSRGTTVRFDLPAASQIHLDVFDVSGRRLRSLLGCDRLEAGRHCVVWDGTTSGGERVGSGMYWVRLSTNDERRSRRVIVIR